MFEGVRTASTSPPQPLQRCGHSIQIFITRASRISTVSSSMIIATFSIVFIILNAAKSLSINANMNLPEGYELPKVWKPKGESGGKAWGNVNRPEAGATHEKELPVGKHPLQLYSFGTPNGNKVTILLEELLELGITEAEYDAWIISIGKGDQFGSGFVDINPNSKIPAMVDHSPAKNGDGTGPSTVKVFESGSILLYLAEKFNRFIPPTTSITERTQCLNWLFWQIGSAPYLGGGYGHFFHYAPIRIEYAVDRYTMETKRQLDVLDKHLAENEYMVGDTYTIADMAIYSWYGELALDYLYPNSLEFLDVNDKTYPNLLRWAKQIDARPAVKKGRIVNKPWGPLEEQLLERHDASDFELRNEKVLSEQKEQK